MNGLCGSRIQSVEAISIQFCHSEETPNKISAHKVGLSSGSLEIASIVIFSDDFLSGFAGKVFTVYTTSDIAWAI